MALSQEVVPSIGGSAKDGVDFLILDDLALLLRDLRAPFFTLVYEGCPRLRINPWR